MKRRKLPVIELCSVCGDTIINGRCAGCGRVKK
jgi:hypothetical protein